MFLAFALCTRTIKIYTYTHDKVLLAAYIHLSSGTARVETVSSQCHQPPKNCQTRTCIRLRFATAFENLKPSLQVLTTAF